MKSLYRRYRPLRLEDVVGQEQVINPLIKSLDAGKFSHAYLFVGPRGCGKTSVARILAHKINDFDYTIEDDYVDIIEIDGASNRGIDNIRELREKVLIAPTVGKYKIYIIDEVHMLTKEAFNALLKTLEEPPKHAVFIMATTDAHKVPITITSRAQTFTFRLAPFEIMFNYLKDVAEKEKISITDDALSIIVKRGGGSFRDSLSLLDQISSLDGKLIDKDMVIHALGLPQDEQIATLLANYTACDYDAITSSFKQICLSGIKPETLVEELIAAICDNPQPNLMDLLGRLTDIRAPFIEARLLVALLGNIKMSRTLPQTSQTPQNVAPISVERSPAPSIIGDAEFSWDNFLERVKDLSDVVYLQLKKSSYDLKGNQLTIYPSKNIVRSILIRNNNKLILDKASNGVVKITISELGAAPINGDKDTFLSKISDIMGGEVRNDSGGNPF